MAVNPWKNGYRLNLDGQFYFATDGRGQMHPYQVFLSPTVLYSSSANPRLRLPPSSSYKLPHPCGMCARAIRFSFSLAPLISVCSRMWAERAASPTLKITTSVERGVCECRWAEVAVLGSTHSSQAWDLTAVTVQGEEGWRWKVQYTFCKPFLPENVCCSRCGIPIPLLCVQSWPGAEQLRGDFYFLSYFNQLRSESTHIRRRTTL